MSRPRVTAIALAAALLSAACAVHETTAAETSVLGYWSVEASRGTLAMRLTEQRGQTLIGECRLRSAGRTESCPLQIAYVDSSFRATFHSYSYNWTFEGRHESATTVRGRLRGATFSGPMDEIVSFVKSPRAHPLFEDPDVVGPAR